MTLKRSVETIDICSIYLTDSILMRVSLDTEKYPFAVNGFREESSRSWIFIFCLSSLIEERARVYLSLLSNWFLWS